MKKSPMLQDMRARLRINLLVSFQKYQGAVKTLLKETYQNVYLTVEVNFAEDALLKTLIDACKRFKCVIGEGRFEASVRF